MLIVLSPAKRSTSTPPPTTKEHTSPIPRPRRRADRRAAALFARRIGALMSISALAVLNVARYATWSLPFLPTGARRSWPSTATSTPASMRARSSRKQLDYAAVARAHPVGPVRRAAPARPDAAVPARDGHPAAEPRGKDLYAFWGETVTGALNARLRNRRARRWSTWPRRILQVGQAEAAGVPVITPVFEDWKNGKYKIISFFAKRARGLMARYAAVKGIRSGSTSMGMLKDVRPGRLRLPAGVAANEWRR
jgi:cytoplasmic iron level regulating protein YaaA (DUF328/UPF0246 family)